MKRILFVALCFIALSSKAQIDTVKGATILKPVQINAITKDSVFQITTVTTIDIQDVIKATAYVQLFNRKGEKVNSVYIDIPESISRNYGISTSENPIRIWNDNSVIDNYILFFLKLSKE